MKERVHFNLHTKRWSITRGGRVVMSADSYTLRGVRFVVSEAGRARVLARKCRQVHAWAEGETGEAGAVVGAGAVEVCYNPYRAGTFTTRGGEVVTGAAVVWFIGKRAFARLRGDSTTPAGNNQQEEKNETR